MIPRTWASETKIKERGVDRTSLVVVNGAKIEQYGTKKIVGECMHGMEKEVEVKVADVQRGLLSASRLQEEAGIDTMLTSMTHMTSEGQYKREELEKKRGDEASVIRNRFGQNPGKNHWEPIRNVKTQ